MATHEDITLHIIEVRHPGGILQRKVDSPADTVIHIFQGKDGNDVLLDCQARDIANWAESHDGFEAAFGTITFPPISLHRVTDNPGFTTTLNLGAVCDTGDLWAEVRASGGIGTVFVSSDVATILEQDTEEFGDLSLEEQEAFMDENIQTFTQKLEEALSERGNNYIADQVASEFETAFEDFKRSRVSAPGI